MSRMGWIIVLVGVGIVAAIVLGVLGTRNQPSKTEATNNLCASLKTLDSSLTTLTGLDPSTASKSQYQDDVTAVQDDWDQVKSDAQDVQNADTGQLDSAWDSFSSAVKDVPNDASVQDALNDVTGAAQGLQTAAKSTASQLTNCSIS